MKPMSKLGPPEPCSRDERRERGFPIPQPLLHDVRNARFSQYRRATSKEGSLLSQATSLPPSAALGSARAMATEEYPVYVPTSTTRFAPVSSTSRRMNAPCSGGTCIWLPRSCAVSTRSSRRTSGSRVCRRR